MQKRKPYTKGNNFGRKPGVPNFTTKVVKDAALIAVELSKHSDGKGLVGYLTFLANTYPEVFTRSILAKLLPIQLALKADVSERFATVQEIRDRLRERGVPIDRLGALFEIPRTERQVIDMLPLLPRRDPNA